MTWKELGTGLQAVRDGHDLPYRVAEGLIGLGYMTPGVMTNDCRPTLTARGQAWLTTWEGVEAAAGTLPHHWTTTMFPARFGTDPRD